MTPRPRAAPDWSARIERALDAGREGNDLGAVRAVVDGLRPTDADDPAQGVRSFAAYLETSAPESGPELGQALRRFLRTAHVFPALTESGVPGGEGFVVELLGRLGSRFLPSPPDPTDLRDHVRDLFGHRGDHLWVEAVSDAEWTRVLDVLGLTAESVVGVGRELALAMRVLAHHVASLGLQPQVTQRLTHLESDDAPFLILGEQVLRYLNSFDDDIEGNEEPLLEEALAIVARCCAEVERLRSEKGIHGTSLWLTSLSFRLLKLLERLDLLLHLSEPVERDFQGSAVRLFKAVVRAERTRDHVAPHVKASADLLAFQVVEHAARKGSKYITAGRREYLLFFLSSLGGGLIVALFALGKLLMAKWNLPLGVQGLLYGVNYSVCFVLIYLTGATLATKQPAMTANTVARSLGDAGQDLAGLEELIVRVWRSQFVSFMGNLLMAFPVALLLSELFFRFGGELVAPPDKARDMLLALHPWWSGTVFYAALAGVLLFGAGLVAGWVDNWVLHRGVKDRVARNLVLRRTLGPLRAEGLGAAVHDKAGILTGNVFLGFGLGSLGTVGAILGLPLDIRHIAFASAEFGMSLEVLRFDVAPPLLLQVVLGVMAIGLINFLVSFGLSLVTALESRNVGFGETRRLLVRLLARLRRRPLDWFFPQKPSERREAAD